MKRFLPVILFYLISFPVGAQERDLARFFEIETLFLKSNYSEALKQYNTFLRDYPDSGVIPQVHYRRAVSLFHLKKFGEALDLFNIVEQKFRDERFVEHIPFWKGLCKYQLKEYKESVENLNTFIFQSQDRETLPQAYMYSALSQIELGELKEASTTVLTLYNEYPQSEFTHRSIHGLLSAILQEELYQDILDFTDKIGVETLPQELKEVVYLYRAEAFAEQGEDEAAREIYKKLRDAVPSVALTAYQRLYFFAEQEGDYPLMDAILIGVEEKFAGRPDILKTFWLRAGIESFRRENLDLAEYFFSKIWNMRETEPIPVEVPLYMAETFLRKDRPEEAKKLLTLYQSMTDTVSPEVSLKTGKIFLAESKYSEAVKYFVQVKNSAPESPLAEEAGYYIAYSYLNMDKPDEALDEIEETLKSFPKGEYHRELLKNRAFALWKLQRLTEAGESYREYLSSYPSDAQAWVDLFKVLVKDGRYGEVIEANKALKAHIPDMESKHPSLFLTTQYLFGLSSFFTGSFDDAVYTLNGISKEKAVKQNLTYLHPFARFYTGWALYKLERYREAADLLTGFSEEFGEHRLSQNALYLAGWCYFKLKQYDEASASFSKVTSKDDDLVIKAMYQNALSLKEMKKYGDSAGLLKWIYENNPGSFLADDAMLEHADVLAKMGDMDGAISTYRELPEKFPGSELEDDALFRTAVLLLSGGEFAKAGEAFKEYERRFPRGEFIEDVLYYGGEAAARRGEPVEALLLWEKLINTRPEGKHRMEALSKAAEIYGQRKDYRKAIRLYDTLIKDYPHEAPVREIEERITLLGFLEEGYTQQVAELKTIILYNDGANTGKGREAMVELASLYILDNLGDVEEARDILTKVIEKGEVATFSRAQYLLGEYYFRKRDYQKAYDAFVKAADKPSPEPGLAPRTLYRAAEMMRLLDRPDMVRSLVERIKREYPDSEWVREGENLLKGIQ